MHLKDGRIGLKSMGRQWIHLFFDCMYTCAVMEDWGVLRRALLLNGMFCFGFTQVV